MDRTVTRRLLVILFLSYSLSLLLPGCGTAIEGISGIPPVPSGNSITLAWQAPVTNDDGSQLKDLAGYKVYYGLSSGIYTDIKVVRGETTCRIDDLPGETMIYLAVSAFDTSRNESRLSTELETYLPAL
jgi:hypothetical protein